VPLKGVANLFPFRRVSRIVIRYENIVAPAQTNLLQGTLDLLILKALSLRELHGLAVAQRIEQITRGTFSVGPGSLFPALHRLQANGWLQSQWGASENNRKAKFYKLTRAGQRQLAIETGQWKRVATAIAFALEAT
jgi:transcriptional regulator